MNSKVFWILSAKLVGSKSIGVGDSDICVLMKEIVVDMIAYASNLLQIKCFSANGEDKSGISAIKWSRCTTFNHTKLCVNFEISCYNKDDERNLMYRI